MQSPRINARQFRSPSKLIIPILISLMMYAAFLAGLVFLAMLFLFNDRHFGIWFLGAVAAVIVLGVLRYLFSLGCLCPLCRGPFMAKKNCGMHERARSHLGLGHRASLTLDVVFLGWFVCPYCGTSFRMRK